MHQGVNGKEECEKEKEKSRIENEGRFHLIFQLFKYGA
jgi:hypothetical protein